GLRTLIVGRLCSGTIDQAHDGVLFLLRSTSHEPELGFLFADPARILVPPAMPSQAGAPTVYRNVTTSVSSSRTIAVAAPVAFEPRRLEELLKRAQDRGTLATLEQAALAQWEAHPDSSHLGALVILARFQHGDIPGAAAAVERWGKILASR